MVRITTRVDGEADAHLEQRAQAEVASHVEVEQHHGRRALAQQRARLGDVARLADHRQVVLGLEQQP